MGLYAEKKTLTLEGVSYGEVDYGRAVAALAEAPIAL
jgi:hypothetical protein